MTSIPFTSWEQAVFVTLFAVFVIGILTWAGKREEKWQKFIQGQDEKWRNWIEDQRERDNAALCDLTAAIKSLNDDLREHDAKVESRINASEKYVIDKTNGEKPKRKAVQSSV
jgi:hypothetical protein